MFRRHDMESELGNLAVVIMWLEFSFYGEFKDQLSGRLLSTVPNQKPESTAPLLQN